MSDNERAFFEIDGAFIEAFSVEAVYRSAGYIQIALRSGHVIGVDHRLTPGDVLRQLMKAADR